MPTTPTYSTILSLLRAGDLWTWKESAPSDYPNSTYTLKYELQGLHSTRITLTATASGADYLFSILPSTSKTYLPGKYRYIKYFELTSTPANERKTIEEGTLEILENIATTQGGYDARSKLQKSLDQVDNAIVSYSVRPVDQITIGSGVGSRTLVRPKLEDLLKVRNQLLWEIQEEEAAEKLKKGDTPSGHRVKVRLGAIS